MKPAAYKLPHLLSLLPKGGANALVRPTKFPNDSFYKVTRTALTFDEKITAGEAGAADASVALVPRGRAWGFLFWKGKLVEPRKGAPSPKIRGGLKHAWVAVEPSSLSPEVIQEIDAGEHKVTEMQQAHDSEVSRRRARKLSVLARKAQEKHQLRDARLAAAHASD